MRSNPDPFTHFSVHVAPNPQGGTHVAIFGELDDATTAEVDAALDAAISGKGSVVIDLRACGFVDSRGIGTLVRAALRLRELDRDLLICGVQPRVMLTLERCGIPSMDHLSVEPQPSGAAGPGTLTGPPGPAPPP